MSFRKKAKQTSAHLPFSTTTKFDFFSLPERITYSAAVKTDGIDGTYSHLGYMLLNACVCL